MTDQTTSGASSASRLNVGLYGKENTNEFYFYL